MGEPNLESGSSSSALVFVVAQGVIWPTNFVSSGIENSTACNEPGAAVSSYLGESSQ